MKINNIEISTLGLTLLDYNIGSIEIENRDEWTDGRLTPFLDSQFLKFRTVTLELLLERATDDEAEKYISKITELCRTAVLEFDNISIKRKGVLEDISNDRIVPGKHDIFISLKCEYGLTAPKTQTITGVSGNITLDSTAPTPVKLEVTPTTAGDIIVKGFDDDILLKSVPANKTVKIDGETGIVTIDGVNAYDKYKSWTFPKIKPGPNPITISKTGVNIKVDYIPRWF